MNKVTVVLIPGFWPRMVCVAGLGREVCQAHLAQGGLAVEEGAVHACSDGVQKPDGCHGQVVLCRAGTFRPAVVGGGFHSKLHLTGVCAGMHANAQTGRATWCLLCHLP